MEKDGILPVFNHSLIGDGCTHPCWEVRRSQLDRCDFDDVLCLVCYVTLPMTYHILYAAWLPYSRQIAARKFDKLVFSYLFVPAASKDEAAALLGDLCRCNPALHFHAEAMRLSD